MECPIHGEEGVGLYNCGCTIRVVHRMGRTSGGQTGSSCGGAPFGRTLHKFAVWHTSRLYGLSLDSYNIDGGWDVVRKSL